MSRTKKEQLIDTEFVIENAKKTSKRLSKKKIGIAESNEQWKHNNTIIRALLTECIYLGIENE